MNSNIVPGEITPRVVELGTLPLEPDPKEVFRYLGYPAQAKLNFRIARRVYQAIELSRDFLQPKAIYSIHAVTHRTPRRLQLTRGVAFSGPVRELLGAVNRVAVFLTTAGAQIVRQVDEAMRAGNSLEAMIFSAIGSHVADSAVTRLAAELRSTLNGDEAITMPFSPGYCGISLDQQRTIFSLLDGARIGVELLPTLIMKPVKSVSGLLGIGPADAIAVSGNPCERCPMVDCRMRR